MNVARRRGVRVVSLDPRRARPRGLRTSRWMRGAVRLRNASAVVLSDECRDVTRANVSPIKCRRATLGVRSWSRTMAAVNSAYSVRTEHSSHGRIL